MSGPLSVGVMAEEKFVHRCPVAPRSEIATGAPLERFPIVTVPEVELTVIPPAPISSVASEDAPATVVAADDAKTSPLMACEPERETLCGPDREAIPNTAVSLAFGVTAAGTQPLLPVLHASGVLHDGAKKPAVPLQ
jgi:hypothetical protein